ncbi:MAG: Asp-tRNA(Asn)/Glu-tRNA(Gln) amidotransferase subunit GatA [Oscillospiraceae bacterium]
MDITAMTALEISSAIKEKKISVKEAVMSFFDAIDKVDEKYHCYNTVCKEEALKRADEVQIGIDNGKYKGLLAGVPIGIKDNICTKDIKTTCSSKILENFFPVYNATVVERLNSEGMVIIGKLNMDEFAMGSTTETSYTGVTHNPWDENKVPGGSSGGAAAAVAAKLSPVTLGSDTGGSIRQPCSFCGVSGLKPTYGAVSRYGLIAYASSLDQIGPMGKTVADCAAVFSVISGKDKKDGTSMEVPKFDLEKANLGNIKGKIIGIPEDYLAEGIAEDVKQSILDAAKKFEELGATIETFKMPIVKYAIPAYYIIACAEASSNLSRYDGIKYGYSSPSASNLSETYIKSRSEAFGMEVKRRIMLGNFVLSSGYYDAYYKKALQAKALVQKAFNEAFLKYDMLLGPVAPTTALKIGESLSDPLKMYLGDIYTVMINIAGLPSMSVPCGFDNEDMPIGMQIIGKPFEEAEIMNAATAFQNSTEYHKRLPILR